MGYGQSDEEGYYRVACLSTDDYYVRVSKKWDEPCYPDKWYQDANRFENDPPPIDVATPNETSNIDFILDEGGTISGQIVDAAGTPLQDIGINVRDSTGYLVGEGYSDSAGYYTVDCLSSGDYYVRVGMIRAI